MSKNNETPKPLSDDTLLTFMQYYQEEFMFRHKHYWDILIKMFVFDVIILILPITTEVMGISLSEGKNTYALIFPCFGLLIAILTMFILKEEGERITSINAQKYTLLNRLTDSYLFNSHKDKIALKTSNGQSIIDVKNQSGNISEKKKYLATHLALVIFIIEALMCIIVFFIILSQQQINLSA